MGWSDLHVDTGTCRRCALGGCAMIARRVEGCGGARCRGGRGLSSVSRRSVGYSASSGGRSECTDTHGVHDSAGRRVCCALFMIHFRLCNPSWEPSSVREKRSLTQDNCKGSESRLLLHTDTLGLATGWRMHTHRHRGCAVRALHMAISAHTACAGDCMS